MVAATLVESDIEASRALVTLLESAGFPLKAALWVYQSDAGRWRFVVCPTEKRNDVTSFYRDFAKVITKANGQEAILPLDRVDIVDDKSPLVAGLGKVLRIEGLGNVRFTNNRINGVFLEDALIFRLAA